MATLDRQTPSPDPRLYPRRPWSPSVGATATRVVRDSSLENRDGEISIRSPALRLCREEMKVYGQFPELDDRSLFVRHSCDQVVRPQGIFTHYDKRHSSPVPSRSPLGSMKPKAPSVASPVAPPCGPGDTLSFRVPKDFPHSRFSKAPLAVYPPKGARSKTCVSLPVVSLEKIPCLGRANAASHVRLAPSASSSSASSSSSSSSATPSPSPLKPPTPLRNGGGPPTPPSSLDRRPSPACSPLDRHPAPSAPARSPSASPLESRGRPSPSPSPSPTHRPAAPPLDRKHQNGAKVASGSHRRLSGRVFDPNKHCGVPDPETKRACTRSLTCKTHSLTHRRAVPDRRTDFDILLAEHKGRAKEKEREGVKEKERAGGGGGQGRKDGSGQETPSPSRPHCPNGRALSTLKLRLANAHVPRVPGSTSSTSVAVLQTPASASHTDPLPHGWARTPADGAPLSSDDGEAETPDDADGPPCHFSTHHPRPLGFCVFSNRLMGRGHFVFDRRWDRMRLALQNMVEKHLNAQMWRKVPLATESFLASGNSTVSPQQPRPPSPTSPDPPRHSSPSPCDPSAYAATAPQSASTAGVFGVKDSSPSPALVSLHGKPCNGSHRPARPSREREDYLAGAKKRKNPSSSWSPSSSSSSSSSPSVANHKRNGSSCCPDSVGVGVATPGQRRGPERGGGRPGSREEYWLSLVDRSVSHSTQYSLDSAPNGSGNVFRSPKKDSAPVSQPLAAPPSSPLAYGGGARGRRRRSPSPYGAKASKLSRPGGGLGGLFRKGSDAGGILSLGPESPGQDKMHH